LLDAHGNVLTKFAGFQTPEGLEGAFAEFLP
jgi:hypothetical protein